MSWGLAGRVAAVLLVALIALSVLGPQIGIVELALGAALVVTCIALMLRRHSRT